MQARFCKHSGVSDIPGIKHVVLASLWESGWVKIIKNPWLVCKSTSGNQGESSGMRFERIPPLLFYFTLSLPNWPGLSCSALASTKHSAELALAHAFSWLPASQVNTWCWFSTGDVWIPPLGLEPMHIKLLFFFSFLTTSCQCRSLLFLQTGTVSSWRMVCLDGWFCFPLSTFGWHKHFWKMGCSWCLLVWFPLTRGL